MTITVHHEETAYRLEWAMPALDPGFYVMGVDEDGFTELFTDYTAAACSRFFSDYTRRGDWGGWNTIVLVEAWEVDEGPECEAEVIETHHRDELEACA